MLSDRCLKQDSNFNDTYIRKQIHSIAKKSKKSPKKGHKSDGQN
jgi:hypothetical protein